MRCRTALALGALVVALLGAACSDGGTSSPDATAGAVDAAEEDDAVVTPGPGEDEAGTPSPADSDGEVSAPGRSTGDDEPAADEPGPDDPGGEEVTELTLPEGDEPETLGPLGDTEVELDTDEGSVQIGSAEVPEELPDSFPLPDDLVVRLASVTTDALGFSGSTALGFDELVDFYADGLPDAGYETEQLQLVDGAVAVFGFEGPDGTGQVAISSTPGGGGHDVLVTFEP